MFNFVHGIGILVDKPWLQPSHTKARSILWCPGNRQFFRMRLVEQVSLSGKSPVFPDKVGRKVFSVLHNRYGLKVMGFVEWSVDGPAQLCPRNRHFGGQTRSFRTTLSTESALWWTNRSLSNSREMRRSSHPNLHTMLPTWRSVVTSSTAKTHILLNINIL